MIYKAFSFPSAPEVGRIIDRSQKASTVNFKNPRINPSALATI
ncbi:Transporter, EamA family [Pseudomonas coronafaciens pv. atropurpurea]|nr:Transporter, EamA family [Pseudomonas coronafaciens pv. atropurpurea]